MSFGSQYGVDLFGVGDLADRISHDFRSAASASSDVKSLERELSTISASIMLLTSDSPRTQRSIISLFSPDRMIVLHNEATRTQDTLVELWEYVRKHSLLSVKERGMWRRSFDRIKYARDAKAIEGLRRRLDGHAGMLQLLLTSMRDQELKRLLPTVSMVPSGEKKRYSSYSSGSSF
jgi:hypothetical protein